MAKTPVHVTVTGAAGQIGYAIVHRIAAGELLGADQPVFLRLLDIEPAMGALEGVVMELEDGAHDTLVGIEPTADLKTAFDGSNWALLIGSVPRKAGMERGDLLSINGGIFKPQGQAINDHAASDVRVLVVGNPANTNCLIARSNAPDVPDDRWFAMTRLDENRAKTQLAKKAGVHHGQVTNMAIWGNHSATQFPDYAHARIDGRPVPEVITDTAWLQGEFLETVQKRGAAVIEKRGASSAASAAHAAIDSVRSVHFADAGRRLALARGRQPRRVRHTRGPAVRVPGAQRRVVDDDRRRHRARRVRAGQDRDHHARARRRARGSARARIARRLTTPSSWRLEFAQPDGTRGSVDAVAG